MGGGSKSPTGFFILPAINFCQHHTKNMYSREKEHSRLPEECRGFGIPDVRRGLLSALRRGPFLSRAYGFLFCSLHRLVTLTNFDPPLFFNDITKNTTITSD